MKHQETTKANSVFLKERIYKIYDLLDDNRKLRTELAIKIHELDYKISILESELKDIEMELSFRESK